MISILEIIGWCGTLFLSGSYILLTLGLFENKKNAYQLISGFGAVLIIIFSYFIDSYEAIALNIIWLGISLSSVLKINLSFLFKSISVFYNFLVFLVIAILIFSYYQYTDWQQFFVTSFATIGIYLYVGAYFLFSHKTISENVFYKLNIIGAVIYIPALIADGNYPVILIETVGILFSIYGLSRIKQK